MVSLFYPQAWQVCGMYRLTMTQAVLRGACDGIQNPNKSAGDIPNSIRCSVFDLAQPC